MNVCTTPSDLHLSFLFSLLQDTYYANEIVIFFQTIRTHNEPLACGWEQIGITHEVITLNKPCSNEHKMIWYSIPYI